MFSFPRVLAGALCVALASFSAGAQHVGIGGAGGDEVEVRYGLIKLDDLGGTVSGANSINNRGWVAGLSNKPGDTIVHAALWRHGKILDFKTLGGPHSAVSWPVKADNGLVVGISEIAALDPFGATFSCKAFFGITPFNGHSCQGFRWKDGVMTALPTLGGFNSYATAANNRGQIVGWAENRIEDTTCTRPLQFLQFHAVIWGPKEGQIQELLPITGDSSTAATAINDKGQVVGISGACDRARGRFSARAAVLWENGVPEDIGNFGGIAWNTPTAINNLGQIAGFSDFPGDENGALNAHAFFWTREGGMQDLDVLTGDAISLAFGLNNQGHVVGLSIGPSGSRAFLWKNGKLMDLNDLIPPGSVNLDFANDINDRGEIAGGATDLATGESFAFIAVPSRDGDQGEDNNARRARNGRASASPQSVRSPAAKAALPEHVLQMLRQKWGIELESVR